MKSLTEISKLISLVLRHKPEELGLTMDGHGWVRTEALIEKLNAIQSFDMGMLQEIVATDSKQRYSFNADKSCIRANQGCSHMLSIQKLFSRWKKQPSAPCGESGAEADAATPIPASHEAFLRLLFLEEIDPLQPLSCEKPSPGCYVDSAYTLCTDSHEEFLRLSRRHIGHYMALALEGREIASVEQVFEYDRYRTRALDQDGKKLYQLICTERFDDPDSFILEFGKGRMYRILMGHGVRVDFCYFNFWDAHGTDPRGFRFEDGELNYIAYEWSKHKAKEQETFPVMIKTMFEGEYYVLQHMALCRLMRQWVGDEVIRRSNEMKSFETPMMNYDVGYYTGYGEHGLLYQYKASRADDHFMMEGDVPLPYCTTEYYLEVRVTGGPIFVRRVHRGRNCLATFAVERFLPPTDTIAENTLLRMELAYWRRET